MPTTKYLEAGALKLTDEIRTMLASSTLHLVKEPFTPAAAMDPDSLVEADYSDYAAVTLTAWGNSYLPNEGGAATRSGEVQFNFVPETPPDPDVANIIYGWWVQLSVAEGEAVLVVGSFDEPFTMAGLGDATFVNVVLGFGAS